MDEESAQSVAEAIGGDPWNSGGNIWLVLCNRSDGKLVVVTNEAVTEYANQDAFDENHPSATIFLH
ncbi:hypothetical protein ACFLT7_07050 [candidate division KSB1 bacterium]